MTRVSTIVPFLKNSGNAGLCVHMRVADKAVEREGNGKPQAGKDYQNFAKPDISVNQILGMFIIKHYWVKKAN